MPKEKGDARMVGRRVDVGLERSVVGWVGSVRGSGSLLVA